MLFVLVGTHDPQTCPASSEEVRQKALSMDSRLNEVMESHGVAMQGTWIDQASHTIYNVVDAPGAHEAQAALIDLGLVEWNMYDIHPVVTPGELRWQN